jgi:hypothetical protein
MARRRLGVVAARRDVTFQKYVRRAVERQLAEDTVDGTSADAPPFPWSIAQWTATGNRKAAAGSAAVQVEPFMPPAPARPAWRGSAHPSW